MPNFYSGPEWDRGSECIYSPDNPDQVSLPFCGQHGFGPGVWSRHFLANEDFQVQFYSSGGLPTEHNGCINLVGMHSGQTSIVPALEIVVSR